MNKTNLFFNVVTDLRNVVGSIETLVLMLKGNQSDSAAPVKNRGEMKVPKKQ
ncbi:hypothetical protein [Lysinibacillus fusiformis]|uniref:hypothetical protein n=1 Tax=Lysinibacillus fusiformis TaxID=28031 RepID=UPI0020BEAEA1|nr:hypothetical protein [Lysinibacillus fusiformis]